MGDESMLDFQMARVNGGQQQSRDTLYSDAGPGLFNKEALDMDQSLD